jgi:cholesterol transport system auxiliary component
MTIPRIALLSLLLAACAGTPKQQSNLAYYDVPASVPELPAPLRSLDVVPASWMASNAMYYRLAYAGGSRREHYAESRWTAQPSELLTVSLKRSLMGSAETLSSTTLLCRLRLDLDDLVQVFDAPGSSRLVLEGRATLHGAQQAVLARRAFSLSQPAGADAVAGVAASGPLVNTLARELQTWVRQECRKTP